MVDAKKTLNKRGIIGWVNPYHYNLERWAYTFQRVTGIAILLYVLGHIGETSFFVGGPFGTGPDPSNWSEVQKLAFSDIGSLILVLTVLVVVFHGINGIRLILSEFGIIFQKPSKPEFPYKAKSRRAIQRHLIWVAIVAAIVAALWTGTIVF